MTEQTGGQRPRTPWHRFLAKSLDLSVGREQVLVQSEAPTGNEPPKVDVVLLRRETATWTAAQRAMLPDGVRETDAATILLEFKYSESLTVDAVRQALAYEYFYRTGHELRGDEVQMFILVAKTPQAERLATFGFAATALPGVYRSENLYVAHLTLVLLNELRPEPHNALVKAFASRHQEKLTAFRLLRQFWRLSAELLLMLEVLQAIWALPEGAAMEEILTPERVMEIGEEWKRILLRNLSSEELDTYLDPAYKQTLLRAGQAEGREEGEHTARQMVEQILQRRLGAIPTPVGNRLHHCTLAELNALVNPALDAETWEVFAAALPAHPADV
ncbi:MAG: hypothetical protein R3C14_42215 [Caldilineaceae bacterium]